MYRYASKTKRVLFISYRKTLSDDIKKNFPQFHDYREGTELYNHDKLIIQPESIHKLLIETDKGLKIPYYDMVICDECEGLLNNFQSTTFKNTAKNKFTSLCHIIEEAKRVIYLDGDLNNRSYDFINSFPHKATNIINNIKINSKTFHITKNMDHYKQLIHDDLTNNLKLVIASLSAMEIERLTEYITEQFPNKKLGMYTGTGDDSAKLDFQNVECWKEKDVILYTPCLESGVDFSLKHFDKLYCIICPKSASSRAFLQMCSRVRNFVFNDIVVLNEKLSTEIKQLELFDDIERALYKNLTLDCDKIRHRDNTGIYYQLSPDIYNKIFIYNELESINNDKYFFTCFNQLCSDKGHKIIHLNDNKSEKELNLLRIQQLINIEDINKKTFEQLLKLSEIGKASHEQKLKIERYVLKLLYGIDTLNTCDDKQIQTLNYSVTDQRLQNYTFIINPVNINNMVDDNKQKIINKKALIIRSVLDTLKLDISP